MRRDKQDWQLQLEGCPGRVGCVGDGDIWGLKSIGEWHSSRVKSIGETSLLGLESIGESDLPGLDESMFRFSKETRFFYLLSF